MVGINGSPYDFEMSKIVRENPAVTSRFSPSELEHISAASAEIKSLKRAGVIECETCANRMYQDGSDEMVSFKAPGHIAPQESGSRVRSHEQEHVANAYSKASSNDGKVVNASVSIKTSICPECGRSYVSGGLTTTQIKYNTDNPYDANKKEADSQAISGAHINYES